MVRAPPPSLQNKFWRSVWMLAYYLFFRFTPTPMFAWRRMVLRLFGARIANDAEPYSDIRVWAPWQLTMEKGSGLGPEVDCYCVAPIVLRERALVSQMAYLCSASHDMRDPSFPLVVAPIEIGPDAWVAARAFIGPGVVVGANAVVGACAVVTKNVPANAVVAGNPATIVGSRWPQPGAHLEQEWQAT